MNPNDETIYQPIEEQDRNENNEVKEEKVTPKSENKGGGWAKLAIGGVTGIFMGAGAMYAGKPYLDDMAGDWKESLYAWAKENGFEDKIPGFLKPEQKSEPVSEPEGEGNGKPGFESPQPEPEKETAQGIQGVEPEPQNDGNIFVPNELHVATVNQDLSFGEAFAQARAEVGPGGVFHWHGGVFNTYTEAEWNAMTPASRSEFAHQVAPEVHHRLDISEDMVIQSPVDDTVIDTNIGDSEEADIVMVSDSDPDVQILGVQQTVNEDGSVVNLGFGNVDGDPVILVDMDGPEGNGPDGIFESRVTDYDHDGEPEVVDISDIGITVDAWANEAIVQNHSVDGTYNSIQSDTISQDELAQGEPDYMNDADTSDIYSA